MTTSLWMVRSASGGRLAEECVSNGIVAIGWSDIGDLNQYKTKEDVIAALAEARPDWSRGKLMAAASQLIRFRDELAEGDYVVTYDASRRIYHVGKITGPYRFDPSTLPDYVNTRPIDWIAEVDRDKLSTSAKNSLGATMTIFSASDVAASELIRLSQGGSPVVAEDEHEESESETEEEILDRYKEEAFEFIKDRVSKLDWDEMENLVAGLLRAMGYKTQVSDPGPDRGVDVMASPDGFGFESPRIMVEVKHRPNQSMGSQEIRSFLGGRHKDDKGLYVSTGGFTKDARYEAERANIPLMLMDIDGLVKALTLNYEGLDLETKNLLPLRKIYWPV